MKKIRTIILTFIMSILMVGIVNAYVESSEFVTKNEWKKMVASMSETLEYLSFEYIYNLCNENDKLREIKERAEQE